MPSLIRLAPLLGLLLIEGAAAAQQTDSINGRSADAAAPTYQPTSLRPVVIYLHHVDGGWSASLTGDVKDAATEKIEVGLADGSFRVMADALPRGNKVCLTKMADRRQFGYLECNSAFYTANKGSTATATLLRGVLSLGILTMADAASGNTGFTVSLDQKALETAAAEAGAFDLAREAAPLIEYREAFAAAVSSRQLQAFISRYDGVFDPESLVAKAREKLPGAIEREQERARQQAEAAARQAEAQRQQEVQRQAGLAALAQFQRGLQPGDRVKMMRTRYMGTYGMIVEMKPPLAYMQWENFEPRMEWVRLDSLLPPR